jgi:PAS domain S-box-containing protein
MSAGRHRPGWAIDPATQSIAENSPDNIMLLDPEGRIRYINWTVPDLSREQVIGTPVTGYVPEASRSCIEACLERVRQTHQHDRYETSYVAADGEVSYWESRVAPVVQRGKLTGFTVNSSNVSERRKAAADRDRFFNLSIDILVVATVDGYLIRANPAFERVLGYDPQQLTAVPASHLIHPDDLESTERQIARLASGESVIDFENRLRRKDGAYRTVSWRSVADPDRRVIYGVGRDVTDQQAFETQVREAQRMDAVGQLAGGIAHDFNNLMLAIIGNVDLAELGDSPENRRRSHDEIRRAAERAAELTRQLLLFSRRQPIIPVVIDLNAIIGDALNLLGRLLPEDIAIDYRPAPALMQVRADPSQVEQVLLNLCVNARDAMPGGGRLTIAIEDSVISESESATCQLAAPGRYACMRVADTGQGMTPEVRQRIFEPFFTTKEQGKGTGLGLAMVYGIVKSHGGGLRVDSAVGQGSTFEVFWPASSGEVGGVERSDEVHEEVPRGRQETVLVAEDQDSVRAVVVHVLENAGYRVIAARDGVEAVRLFKNKRRSGIALVLLDLVMPGLGGRDAYAEIVRVSPGQPVLFTSGYSEHLASTDAATVLAKPFRPGQLLRLVRAAIDRVPSA